MVEQNSHYRIGNTVFHIDALLTAKLIRCCPRSGSVSVDDHKIVFDCEDQTIKAFEKICSIIKAQHIAPATTTDMVPADLQPPGRWVPERSGHGYPGDRYFYINSAGDLAEIQTPLLIGGAWR